MFNLQVHVCVLNVVEEKIGYSLVYIYFNKWLLNVDTKLILNFKFKVTVL